MDVSAVALFCDDIREEKSGAITLVGIMPDNVEVPSIPGALPRLAIYVRVHLKVELPPEPIEFFLTFTDGAQHKITEFSRELIETTTRDAVRGGNKLAGLFSNVLVATFPVPVPGRAFVTLKRGGEIEVIGGLNFVTAKRADNTVEKATTPSPE